MLQVFLIYSKDVEAFNYKTIFFGGLEYLIYVGGRSEEFVEALFKFIEDI